MKIEKGQPGYLKAERNKLLAQTLIEFVIVVAVSYTHLTLPTNSLV